MQIGWPSIGPRFRGAQSGDLDAALECAEERLAVLRGIHDLSMEDGDNGSMAVWGFPGGTPIIRWMVFVGKIPEMDDDWG